MSGIAGPDPPPPPIIDPMASYTMRATRLTPSQRPIQGVDGKVRPQIAVGHNPSFPEFGNQLKKETQMSAKSTLPSYVVSALHAERKAQLSTLAAVVVYMFNEVKADRELTDTGAKLHKVSPHRSLKTWQNYAAAAGAVATAGACAVKLESLHAEHQNPADSASAFAPWLESHLKAKGYTSSIDDIARYAKGKPSLKAQQKAEEEAQKALATAEAQAQAQAQEPEQTPEAAPVVAQEPEPEQAQAPVAIPPTIQPVMVAPLLIARRAKDGSLDLEYGPDMTVEEIEAIVSKLQTLQIAMMMPEQVAA